MVFFLITMFFLHLRDMANGVVTLHNGTYHNEQSQPQHCSQQERQKIMDGLRECFLGEEIDTEYGDVIKDCSVSIQNPLILNNFLNIFMD